MKTSTVAFYAKKEGMIEVYRLPENQFVPTFECYSYSVILALGAYMVWRFPNFSVPGIQEISGGKYREETFPDRLVFCNAVYDHWLHFLCNQLILGNALRVGEILYYKIQVDNQYAKLLQENGLKKQVISSKMTWQVINSQINETEVKSQRGHFNVLMLVCTQLSPLIDSFHSPALFMGLYFNNENWKYIRIIKQYPEEEEFIKATHIIVPGSPFCLSGEYPPVLSKLMLRLRKLFDENKQIKYLGICFGHQLLSQIFCPGTVKKAKIPVRAKYCLTNFIESQISSKFNFLQNLKSTNIFSYHTDEVTIVPQNFTLIASSLECNNEGMISHDGRFFTLQGHPEYTEERYLGLSAARRKLERQQILKEQMIEIINDRKWVDESLISQTLIQNYLSFI